MNSIEPLITEWMEHLFIQKGQRLTGVERYAATIRGFFAWIKQTSLPNDPVEITRGDIGEWQKALFYDLGNISNRSRASKLSAVKSFFHWLRYSGRRHDDPTKGIPSPKIQDKLPQKFSTEELRLLFAAPPRDTIMGLRDLAILKTLYAAGPRVSELINLDLNHLVDTGGYIISCKYETESRDTARNDAMDLINRVTRGDFASGTLESSHFYGADLWSSPYA